MGLQVRVKKYLGGKGAQKKRTNNGKRDTVEFKEERFLSIKELSGRCIYYL